MLKITTIKSGVVIDHIRAGLGIKIFNYLELNKVDYPVALIMNVTSNKLGKKDIIKIEDISIKDYTFLKLISPSITINVVKNEEIVEKIKPELPSRVENIFYCKNPRCITSVEAHIPQAFKLTNKEEGIYRCEYCDETSEFSKL